MRHAGGPGKSGGRGRASARGANRDRVFGGRVRPPAGPRHHRLAAGPAGILDEAPGGGGAGRLPDRGGAGVVLRHHSGRCGSHGATRGEARGDAVPDPGGCGRAHPRLRGRLAGVAAGGGARRCLGRCRGSARRRAPGPPAAVPGRQPAGAAVVSRARARAHQPAARGPENALRLLPAAEAILAAALAQARRARVAGGAGLPRVGGVEARSCRAQPGGLGRPVAVPAGFSTRVRAAGGRRA